MKTKSEKTIEEVGHIVYRLDLIPESDQDKEALLRLESQSMDVTDQMIENIVLQRGKALQEANRPDWDFHLEKKKGHSSYFVHLNMPLESNL